MNPECKRGELSWPLQSNQKGTPNLRKQSHRLSLTQTAPVKAGKVLSVALHTLRH